MLLKFNNKQRTVAVVVGYWGRYRTPGGSAVPVADAALVLISTALRHGHRERDPTTHALLCAPPSKVEELSKGRPDTDYRQDYRDESGWTLGAKPTVLVEVDIIGGGRRSAVGGWWRWCCCGVPHSR